MFPSVHLTLGVTLLCILPLPPMSKTASIHLTKLAAAQRQLRAAIRMYFGQEDELATHTVASAAYNLLKDIKASRGRDEVADTTAQLIAGLINAYKGGTLPPEMASDTKTMEWIRRVAEHSSPASEVVSSEIEVSVTPGAQRQYWNKQNKIYNFLKHADRDANSTLPIGDMDNLSLITKATSACEDLIPECLRGEGFALIVYLSAARESSDGLPLEIQSMVSKVREANSEAKLALCGQIARQYNEIL